MRWLVRIFVVLLVGGAALLAWLLGTQSGLRWALRFAPQELQVEGVRGALAGEIAADRIAYPGIEARKVAFELNLLALLTDTIAVNFLRVDALRIQRPESSSGQSKSIALPFRIRVSDAELKSVVVEGYEISNLRFEYSGGSSGHDVQASFSAFGAQARLKAQIAAELFLKEIEAEVRSLSLAMVEPTLPQTALQIRLSARGTPTSLAGKLSATNADAGPLDRNRLPLAALESSFSTDYKSVRLEALRAGALSGKGTLTAERADLDLRIDRLDLRSLYSTLATTRLSGGLKIALEPQRQRVQGRLAQEDMSLEADAERSGDTIEVRALRAQAAGGEARGSGRVRLGAPPSFDAVLDLARFDPSRFGDYPAGSINGKLIVSGDASRRGSANWAIAESTLLGYALASSGKARLIGERILDADAWITLGANRATAKGAFGGPRDQLAWTLDVPDLAALQDHVGGQVRARGTATGTYQQPRVALSAEATRLQLGEAIAFDRATVRASGTLENHEGEIAGRNSDLDFTAKLRGGWARERWRGEILALTNTGRYALDLQTPAAAEFSATRVALSRFEALLAGGRATVEELRWEDRRLASSGAIRSLPAQWLLSLFKLDQQLAGTLLLDGEWSLVSTPKLNGRVAVRRAAGDLALRGPPQVDFELSRATLDARFAEDRVAAALDIASRLGSVRVEGEAAAIAPDAAVKFTAELALAELRLLTEPLATQVRVSGRIGATLRGSGTLRDPVLAGTLRGDALGVELPPYGVALQGGRLRAELDGDVLRVSEATIAGGDGRFSASGTLPLKQAAGASLEWRAEQFRVLNRPNMRLVASGQGNASFDGKKLGLKGKLRADSGYYEEKGDRLPELSDDIEVAGRSRKPRGKREPLPVDLDLQLDLGNRLALRAFGFDGGIGGQLRLTTSAAGELLAQGQVEAVRARFRAYGQELEVDPGVVVFGGPLESAGLDVSAWRRHQQVEAGVRVTGTLQAPRVELISNPPLSEGEKLSWLVLGRAPSEASGADLAVLQAASGAVLSRGGEPPLHRKLASRLGLDELNVRGSSELSANVVALGKRFSDKLYFSFEQAFGATTEYLVKLDYSLTRRLSLRGQTGTSSSVGFFYRYAWD